jgi:carbon-monoxide dehydrogenase large subunit
VVAVSEEAAEDIADLVELIIDETTPVIDALAALEPGVTQVHAEAPGNVIVEGKFKTPEFDAVWTSAHKIIKLDARSRRQNATPMEARAGHASYDASTGRVTLTCGTQMPHLTRTAIADLLGMPEADLRVIAPDVGGGFGQKMALPAEYAVLVWLARKLKSAVAWTEDRRENLIASFHSRDQCVTLQGAFDANAKLLALKADVVANVGAYSCFPTTCGVEPLMAMAEMPGPYDFRAYECRARGVLTNTCTMAPYRGVSRPVITFTLERLMDKAAAAFAIDPVDIRRRNLIDKFPYTSAMGLVYDEASYQQTLEMAVKAIDVPAFRARQKAARAKGRHLGIGFATFSERTGYGSPAFAARGMDIVPGWDTVVLSVDPSGYVEARIGSSPHGQGLRTSLAQIIADEIGVTPDVIKVTHGDTDRSPYGWGTFGSRSLVISGGATLIAARKVRAKLLTIASHMLEAAPGDIVLENGMAKVAGTDRSVSIAKMAREAYTQTHRFKGEIEPGLTETGSYDPPGTFSNACHVAIVEVEVETGHVAIENFLVAEDAGRIINPMIAEGQVHGGIAQGIGNALLEEIVYDESGGILTANLADYMLPTAREIPPIELHHIETPSTTSITQAKGLGEGGSIGAPAAVINAINDALTPFNVQIDEMPATPQRIRAALRAKEHAA